MKRVMLALILVMTTGLLAIPPARAAPNSRDAFRRLWERCDQPVQYLVVARSWTWGRPISPVVLGIQLKKRPTLAYRAVNAM